MDKQGGARQIYDIGAHSEGNITLGCSATLPHRNVMDSSGLLANEIT
jgi:hypothetical protein